MSTMSTDAIKYLGGKKKIPFSSTLSMALAHFANPQNKSGLWSIAQKAQNQPPPNCRIFFRQLFKRKRSECFLFWRSQPKKKKEKSIRFSLTHDYTSLQQ